MHNLILFVVILFLFFFFFLGGGGGGEGECYGADGISIVVRVVSCLHIWLVVKHVQNAQLKEIYKI